jgi:hypothetical protein
MLLGLGSPRLEQRAGCEQGEILRIFDAAQMENWSVITMADEKTDFQKFDRPFSFRVPHDMHETYKRLSGFERKEIQFKMAKYLQKLLKESGSNE